MNKIKKTLYKYWSKEKSDKFYETLKSSILSYKIDCLEKFIEDIFLENPNVKRDELLKYAKNMDAFINVEEFLISTTISEDDIIRLQDNPNEIEKILNKLLISKKVRVKQNKSEFIVWYI